MTPQESRFLDLVRAKGLVRDSAIIEAVRHASEDDRPIPEYLVQRGLLSSADRDAILDEVIDHYHPAETPTLGRIDVAPTQGTPIRGRVDLTPTLATPSSISTPLPVAPPTGLAGYQILEEIAHGGMGVVYKARQIGLDRIVALKVMIAGEHASPEMLERFQREAKSAARLQHPNIVQIYDVGRDGAKHFFTMRHVDGPPLAERIRRKELTPRRAVELARKVALALDYAHQHGVIHRDVKPANILVDSQGEPHLADFGLAKDLGCEGVTLPGSSLGTPNYASPEQASGETDKVDARSDVYSLGASLYESLTGEPPFCGESIFAVLQEVMTRDPVPPRAVNPKIQRDIETICLKAMAKEPARRYQSAREMADDIGRYLEGEPIHARPVSWIERTARRAIKNRAVVIPSAVAVLVVVAFLGWVGLTAWTTARRVRDEVDSAAKLERQADAAASRDERSALYAKARDVLVGALKLDDQDPRAKAGLARVGGRLDAIAAEEEAERKSASAKAESAESALRKSQLVSKVFARWSRVGGALAELEKIAYDDRLSDEEKVKRAEAAWPPLEQFVKDTPDDSASRATALALAAWAKRYTGDQKAAVMQMKEAAKLDADLPYGRLMEALDIFSQIVEMQPLPSIVIGSRGLEIGEMRGVPENMETAKKILGDLLAKARAARVWGKEGAEDFAACMDGILALQAGEWAKSDEQFSRALTAPDLKTFESGLLLGRAEVRYLGKSFAGAIEDYALLAKARPGWGEVPFHAAQAKFAFALDGAARGDDPRAIEREAIGLYDEAAKLIPGNLEVYANRALAWHSLGEAEALRGGDPLPALQKAIADFEEVLRRKPDHVNACVDLGNTWLVVAEAQGRRGQDPRQAYDRALAAYDAAVAIRPEMAEIWNNRGNAVSGRAEWEAGHGVDPREGYLRSIADYGKALDRRPDMPDAYNNRGAAWNALGWAEAAMGIDPTESYGKAISDYGRAGKLVPAYVECWANLGRTRTNLGEWLFLHKSDPTATLTQAIADFEKAASINAAFVGAYQGEAGAYSLLGQWEGSQGKDPRPTFDKGVAAAGEALRRNPELSSGYVDRGLLWLSRAEWEATHEVDPLPSLDKAIADDTSLVGLNPSSVPALCNRASCYGRKAEAEKRAGRDPKETVAKGIADAKAVLAINPRVWQAHQALGALFEMAGDDDKALEAYERALAIVGEGAPEVRAAIEHLKARRGDGGEK